MFRQKIVMWGLVLLVAFLLGSATSSQALPDLVITTFLGPATVKIGDLFYIAITVKNQGTTDAGPFRLVLYFSTDSTITSSDILLPNHYELQGLAAGVEFYGGCPSAPCWILPAGIQPRNYYLGAIVDDQNSVAESNENNNIAVASTGTVTIFSSSGPEVVTPPGTPTGPASGSISTSYTYTTQGAVSSLGHSVQYLFDWGNGTDSGWLPVGTTSAVKSWNSPNTYPVKAYARCSTDTSVVSAWSGTLNVTIGVPPPQAPWVSVIPPSVAMATNWLLEGVQFTTPTEGWAVGMGDFFSRGDIFLHYSGGAWTDVVPAAVSYAYVLSGVHFTSSSEGWAVGMDDNGVHATGALVHFSGGNWNPVTPPVSTATWKLSGVFFPSPGEGWAVGEDIATHMGILLHYSAGAWSFVSPPSSADLYGVHFTSPNEGWAVGGVNSGVLIHYLGGNWTAVSPPAVSANWYLAGVYFTSPDEGWAVGVDSTNARGVLLHYSGGSWASVTPPVVSASWSLKGVHFTSPDEGWAVGTDSINHRGVLLHYSAGKWTSVIPPSVSSSWYLKGVHFTSAGEGWAVGGDAANKRGALLHYSVQTYPITLNTNPSGLKTLVNGTEYTAPKTFNWAAGAIHNLSVPSPQNSRGKQYTYASWSDGGSQTHDITVPSGSATYTASFSEQTESVSAPTFLTGPTSGNTGTSYSYSTGGSASSLGHTVEYQFDWKGDGSDLSSWGSATQSKTWTSSGAYSVKAKARCEIDTGITSSWSTGLAVNITSPPAPDFTGQWVSFTQTCKTTFKGNQCKESAGFTAQNIGNKDAPSTVYVGFYISGNNTFSQDDTLLKKVSVGKLKKGASKKITLSVTLPVGVTLTGKFVIAVIDPQNPIPESDENNNQIVYGPIP